MNTLVSMRLLAVLLVSLALLSGAAYGSTIVTYSLDVGPTPSPIGSPPWGTITLELISGQIKFTIDMFGDLLQIAEVGFNWGGSGALPSLTLVSPVSGYTLATDENNLSGFGPWGKFDYAVAKNGSDGSSNPWPTPGTFTVAKSGGFSSVEDLIADSNGGSSTHEYFTVHASLDPAFHAIACNSGCTAPVTTSGSVVPEPGVFGTAAVGFAALAVVSVRRRWL